MPVQLTDTEALRRKRQRAAVVRRRRLAVLGLVVAVLVTSIAGVAAARAQNRTAVAGLESTSAEAAVRSSYGQPVQDRYPAFARVESKSLVLPVSMSKATIVAYHSLDDELAVVLTPLGQRIDGSLTTQGSAVAASSQEEGVPYYVLDSKGRSGSGTTAVDIGAPAGTLVVSPVSGTIRSVKQYKLFGKYDDVQIDISPQGLSEVIVTLLLVAEPRINIGESVQAGKTVLGVVRSPVPELAERLSPLTGDEGAHVHLQVTESLPSLE